MQDTLITQPLKAELGEDQLIKAQAILTSIRNGASINDACEAADITRKTWYNWQDRFPELRQLVTVQKAARVETVKGILYECALKAREDSKYQTSVIFLLKTECREIYGDRLSYVDETKAEAIAKALNDDELAEHITTAAIALAGESQEAVEDLITRIRAKAAAEKVSAGTEGAGAVTA